MLEDSLILIRLLSKSARSLGSGYIPSSFLLFCRFSQDLTPCLSKV